MYVPWYTYVCRLAYTMCINTHPHKINSCTLYIFNTSWSAMSSKHIHSKQTCPPRQISTAQILITTFLHYVIAYLITEMPFHYKYVFHGLCLHLEMKETSQRINLVKSKAILKDLRAKFPFIFHCKQNCVL